MISSEIEHLMKTSKTSVSREEFDEVNKVNRELLTKVDRLTVIVDHNSSLLKSKDEEIQDMKSKFLKL